MDKKKDIIKLNFVKDFSNINLFSKKTTPNPNRDYPSKTENIPNYISSSFQFDKDQNQYYLETNIDGKNIMQRYFCEFEIYIVDEVIDTSTEHYEYDNTDKVFTYQKINGDRMDNNFIYDIPNKKCKSRICDENIVNYFVGKYINNSN